MFTSHSLNVSFSVVLCICSPNVKNTVCHSERFCLYMKQTKKTLSTKEKTKTTEEGSLVQGEYIFVQVVEGCRQMFGVSVEAY